MPLLVRDSRMAWREGVFLPTWTLQLILSIGIIFALQAKHDALRDIIHHDPLLEWPPHLDHTDLDENCPQWLDLGITVITTFCGIITLFCVLELFFYTCFPFAFNPGAYALLNFTKAGVWAGIATQFALLMSGPCSRVDLSHNEVWWSLVGIEVVYGLLFALPAVAGLAIWSRARATRWTLVHAPEDERAPLLFVRS